jgi:hypothetical protein
MQDLSDWNQVIICVVSEIRLRVEENGGSRLVRIRLYICSGKGSRCER